VIEFRISSSKLANNCRVTNCVIDNYNNPDRLEEDNWIVLYGRHNRFDHNYIARKKNIGTTLVVQLNDALNQENEHQIDHNYFGERPRLGSNGGETIRVGNSTFSRTSSRTIIEDNYFEHCNGFHICLQLLAV
jgi:poly(beta-D-mannuronate) lyase